MRNYFNYFTEIEEHFQRRRGSLLLLSTLDWALIESWREAGAPLECVLRGIDAAFDKRDARPHGGRRRRVNGLAYCAQEVMAALEESREAAVGAAPPGAVERGLEEERIAAHLEACAGELRAAAPDPALLEISLSLDSLAAEVRGARPDLERIEQKLTVMEQKLLAAAVSRTPEAELLALRRQAADELAPYRGRMQAMQIRQVEQQFLHKKLLEKFRLPRLSLFYMKHS